MFKIYEKIKLAILVQFANTKHFNVLEHLEIRLIENFFLGMILIENYLHCRYIIQSKSYDCLDKLTETGDEWDDVKSREIKHWQSLKYRVFSLLKWNLSKIDVPLSFLNFASKRTMYIYFTYDLKHVVTIYDHRNLIFRFQQLLFHSNTIFDVSLKNVSPTRCE